MRTLWGLLALMSAWSATANAMEQLGDRGLYCSGNDFSVRIAWGHFTFIMPAMGDPMEGRYETVELSVVPDRIDIVMTHPDETPTQFSLIGASCLLFETK